MQDDDMKEIAIEEVGGESSASAEAEGPESSPAESAPEQKEKMSIKGRLDSFEKAQKEMTFASRIAGLALGILGAVWIIVWVILTIVIEDESFFASNWVLLFGVFFAVFGFVFYFAFRSNIKKARANDSTVCTYEMFSDCMIVRTERDGNKLGAVKIPYPHIVKVKETANYIFIYFPTRVSAYCITKAFHDNREYDTIMALLARAKKYGSETIELSSSDNGL